VARALSGHFREVVLIDKDQFPVDAPDHRVGVPQSYHIHNLTLRGQRELEELFPGFVDEAVKLGAMRIDYGRDVARCSELGWQKQFVSGLIALSATRILVEFAERQRFRALCHNVRVLEGTRVLNLITQGEGTRQRAAGVVTDRQDEREIAADFVVDCSGRGTKWKKWFEERNLPLPPETIVDSRCGYSSRFMRPKNPAKYPWKAMVVDGTYPNHPHWGVIVPLENNDWVVTLGGIGENYPPSDEEGFSSCAKSLLTPLYAEALAEAEPLTPIRTFRRMEMRWNHFERVGVALDRFLVIGDAAWAYNPLYGQGMSIGVTCARILRDLLDEKPSLDGLDRRFYPPAKKFAFPAWESTALLDMRWPQTQGKRPWHMAVSRRLIDFAWTASHYDDALFMAVLQNIHLLKQPNELITPRVVWGFLKHLLRRLTFVPLAPMPRVPSLPADAGR
jgi:flavin-dependent dehydrogenase